MASLKSVFCWRAFLSRFGQYDTRIAALRKFIQQRQTSRMARKFDFLNWVELLHTLECHSLWNHLLSLNSGTFITAYTFGMWEGPSRFVVVSPSSQLWCVPFKGSQCLLLLRPTTCLLFCCDHGTCKNVYFAGSSARQDSAGGSSRCRCSGFLSGPADPHNARCLLVIWARCVTSVPSSFNVLERSAVTKEGGNVWCSVTEGRTWDILPPVLIRRGRL